MKKRTKGFTLVECIVAMAILGVASLIVAQIYAAVSIRNKMNNLVNTSLSNQMQYVEKKIDGETYSVIYNNGVALTTGENIPPHKNTSVTINNHVTVTRVLPSGSEELNDKYSFPTDVFVLKSRTSQDQALGTSNEWGYTEKDYNLRYKYVQGNNN